MTKILYLVTEDWYFCSHRLPLARAACQAGYEVVVVTRVNADPRYAQAIVAAGARLVPIDMQRGGQNPFRELLCVLRIARIYQRECPDIVHHVALKPVLYGAIAARLTGIAGVVNALAGMGFIFTSTSFKARLLRPLVQRALHRLLNAGRSLLILQNPDDRQMLVDSGAIDAQRVRLIRGSGVAIQRFVARPEPALGADSLPVVMLPARLLWDKGVGEFVESARLLKQRGVKARFVLVGDSDTENAAAIPAARLQAWQESGVVECWGRRDDMPEVLAQAHLVCLPSYREGLPKVLLEAAACARALVATDVPGCREIVIPGVNGLLAPAQDAPALADAIGQLLQDQALRQTMGQRGRELVEHEFAEEIVVEKTLAIYKELVSA